MEEKGITKAEIEGFGNFLKCEERSTATIEKYLRDVRCFAAYLGTGRIDKETVLKYKEELGSRYAPRSANSMIAALNAFLKFCGRLDLCVKQYRIQREAFCSEEKELSKAEYIRLLETAKRNNDERLNLILQTICGTGIRVSELQYITVEAVRKGEALVCCKGKNRRIFIVSELKKKLLRYAKEQGREKGAIFVTRSGKPVSRMHIWRAMKGLCAEARVSPSKVFPHNLRHLFARVFYELEKDVAKLADILGHASINTTRIYIITTGAEHKRKMEHMRLIL